MEKNSQNRGKQWWGRALLKGRLGARNMVTVSRKVIHFELRSRGERTKDYPIFSVLLLLLQDSHKMVLEIEQEPVFSRGYA